MPCHLLNASYAMHHQTNPHLHAKQGCATRQRTANTHESDRWESNHRGGGTLLVTCSVSRIAPAPSPRRNERTNVSVNRSTSPSSSCSTACALVSGMRAAGVTDTNFQCLECRSKTMDRLMPSSMGCTASLTRTQQGRPATPHRSKSKFRRIYLTKGVHSTGTTTCMVCARSTLTMSVSRLSHLRIARLAAFAGGRDKRRARPGPSESA